MILYECLKEGYPAELYLDSDQGQHAWQIGLRNAGVWIVHCHVLWHVVCGHADCLGHWPRHLLLCTLICNKMALVFPHVCELLKKSS